MNRECKNCKHARLLSLELLMKAVDHKKPNIICRKLEENPMVKDIDAEHSGFCVCNEWEAYK